MEVIFLAVVGELLESAGLGIDLRLALELRAKLDVEVEKTFGNRTAPADTEIGAETLHLQTAADITVLVDRDIVVTDFD